MVCFMWTMPVLQVPPLQRGPTAVNVGDQTNSQTLEGDIVIDVNRIRAGKVSHKASERS